MLLKAISIDIGLSLGFRIWVRSRRCSCLVTWFWYHLITKTDNKTAAPSWPDPLYAWRHQAITWTNVDLSSVRSIDIQLMTISQEMPQPLITKISLKNTYELKKSNDTVSHQLLLHVSNPSMPAGCICIIHCSELWAKYVPQKCHRAKWQKQTTISWGRTSAMEINICCLNYVYYKDRIDFLQF